MSRDNIQHIAPIYFNTFIIIFISNSCFVQSVYWLVALHLQQANRSLLFRSNPIRLNRLSIIFAGVSNHTSAIPLHYALFASLRIWHDEVPYHFVQTPSDRICLSTLVYAALHYRGRLLLPLGLMQPTLRHVISGFLLDA